jgi:pSer/pThr/pTyr-binding forkhead associated (FHA) protein
MPRLIISRPGETPSVFELLGDRPVSIGRAKSSNVVLDGKSISRLHAVLHSTPDGQWQIVDRGSANGLRVNGAAAKEAILRADDEIAIGEFRLRFEDSASRKITSYGTVNLPPRFAEVLRKSSYAGSSLAVESLADTGPAEPVVGAGAGRRGKAHDQENKLHRLLYRVNRALGELNSIEEVNQRTLDFVLEIDGAERGFAMLLDEDSMARGDFRPGQYSFLPALIRYRESKMSSSKNPLPQLAISQTIIRQVMQAGLPMLISDGQADPRFSASASMARGGIQSAMCAPLGIGNRLRGLLYADNCSRRGMFTVDDLNEFSVIAVQAGLAIERIRPRTVAPEHTRA